MAITTPRNKRAQSTPLLRTVLIVVLVAFAALFVARAQWLRAHQAFLKRQEKQVHLRDVRLPYTTVAAMQIAEVVRINPRHFDGPDGSVDRGLVTDGGKPDVALSDSENKDLLLLLRKTKPLPAGATKPQTIYDYTFYLTKAGGFDSIAYDYSPDYRYWSRSGTLQLAGAKRTGAYGVVPEEFRVKIKALLIKRRKEIETAHGVTLSPSPRPPAPVSADGLPLPHPL